MDRQKFRVMERQLTTADEALLHDFDLIVSTADDQFDVEVALGVIAYTATKLIGVGWDDVLTMIESADSARFARAYVIPCDNFLDKFLTEKIELLSIEGCGSSFLLVFLPEQIDDKKNIIGIDKLIMRMVPTVNKASLLFTASLNHWKSCVVIIGFCALKRRVAEAGASRQRLQ